MKFPDGFLWGAATASYQIEGAVRDDGRGTSIWDTFAHTPGKVYGGHTGDIACDHYFRYADDVAMMRDLGLGAYRFSVAWPRIRPDGTGPVNPRGLDFYDRLTDSLLDAGISPHVTLYHWDLPQPMEDAGGWTSRETAEAFADYAAIVGDRLGDRVSDWYTINEPWVAAFLGYGAGIHAPGRTDPKAAFQAAHHLLLGHGLATQALRECRAEHVGIVLNLSPVHGDEPAGDVIDGLLNRQFLDPVLRGHYPDDVLGIAFEHAGSDFLHDGDLAVIAQPVDVLGINYYHPTYVANAAGAPANPAFPGSDEVAFLPADGPSTAMNWPVVPSGLSDLLLRLARDYPETPLMITENGAAFDDPGLDSVVSATGDSIADSDRVAYLDGHLRAVHSAIAGGAPVLGYFVWSLLDNFEWTEGYRRRFGIVAVDYVTQARILKDSARWYASAIRRNGLEEDG